MRQDKIKELLQKYRSGHLNAEEERQLLHLYSSGEEKSLVNALQELLLAEVGNTVVLTPVDPEKQQNTLTQILNIDRTIDRNEVAGVDAEPGVSNERGIVNETAVTGEPVVIEMYPANTWLQRRRRVMIAAVILLLVSLGGFFQLIRQEEPGRMVSRTGTSTEISPGFEGAVLTLGDGSTIILDSLSDGLVASQNGTSVLLNGGKLSYDASNAGTMSYNTMTTPNGRQFQLVLPDGSHVWLNAGSSLRYPTSFSGSNRVVEVSGEAYFEVARNNRMPFHVKVTSNTVIEVLGTHFNVNAYADERSIQTTLLEGAVNVVVSGQSRKLSPGQQARVFKPGVSEESSALNDRSGAHSDGRGRGRVMVQVADNVNLEQVMAWKNGLFHFIDADIKAVMQQLGRWYDMKIIYEGKIPERRFEGKIQRNLNLSEVLESLSKNDIRFRVENKTIIVY